MANLTQKIKTWYLKFNSKKVSFDRNGISPKHDWKVFLISTFILILITASISLYLYIQINSGQLFFTISEDTEKGIVIDKVLLEKTINDINVRKTTLENIKQNKAIPPDPSI